MTIAQINEVSKCSSGTISSLTGICTYDGIDDFISWIYQHGESVEFGDNLLSGLSSAGAAYAGSAEANNK